METAVPHARNKKGKVMRFWDDIDEARPVLDLTPDDLWRAYVTDWHIIAVGRTDHDALENYTQIYADNYYEAFREKTSIGEDGFTVVVETVYVDLEKAVQKALEDEDLRFVLITPGMAKECPERWKKRTILGLEVHCTCEEAEELDQLVEAA